MQALESLTFIVIGGQGIIYPEIHPDDSAILPNVQEFSVKYPQINDFSQLLPFAPNERRVQRVVEAALREFRFPSLRSLVIEAMKDDMQTENAVLRHS